jgi:hypothetical protein
MCRFVVAALLGMLLAGCGLVRQQQLQTGLDGYLGRSIADAIVRWGPPAGQFDIGQNQRAFQWDKRGSYNTMGVVTPMYGSVYVQPGQQVQTQCLLTFKASSNSKNADLSQWIIYAWEYNGQC